MAETYNASTSTKKTALELMSEQYLQQELAINRYSTNNAYGVNNPNAISDGDEFGKGQKGDNGTVGSFSDINNRKDNLGRNKFNSEKGYPDF